MISVLYCVVITYQTIVPCETYPKKNWSILFLSKSRGEYIDFSSLVVVVEKIVFVIPNYD